MRARLAERTVRSMMPRAPARTTPSTVSLLGAVTIATTSVIGARRLMRSIASIPAPWGKIEIDEHDGGPEPGDLADQHLRRRRRHCSNIGFALEQRHDAGPGNAVSISNHDYVSRPPSLASNPVHIVPLQPDEMTSATPSSHRRRARRVGQYIKGAILHHFVAIWMHSSYISGRFREDRLRFRPFPPMDRIAFR